MRCEEAQEIMLDCLLNEGTFWQRMRLRVHLFLCKRCQKDWGQYKKTLQVLRETPVPQFDLQIPLNTPRRILWKIGLSVAGIAAAFFMIFHHFRPSQGLPPEFPTPWVEQAITEIDSALLEEVFSQMISVEGEKFLQELKVSWPYLLWETKITEGGGEDA